jgi:hypothetical protein
MGKGININIFTFAMAFLVFTRNVHKLFDCLFIFKNNKKTMGGIDIKHLFCVDCTLLRVSAGFIASFLGGNLFEGQLCIRLKICETNIGDFRRIFWTMLAVLERQLYDVCDKPSETIGNNNAKF